MSDNKDLEHNAAPKTPPVEAQEKLGQFKHTSHSVMRNQDCGCIDSFALRGEKPDSITPISKHAYSELNSKERDSAWKAFLASEKPENRARRMEKMKAAATVLPSGEPFTLPIIMKESVKEIASSEPKVVFPSIRKQDPKYGA